MRKKKKKASSEDFDFPSVYDLGPPKPRKPISAEEMALPVCKNCVHYKESYLGVRAECIAMPVMRNHVTGTVIYADCKSERDTYGACGKEGKNFKPKPAPCPSCEKTEEKPRKWWQNI